MVLTRTEYKSYRKKCTLPHRPLLPIRLQQ